MLPPVVDLPSGVDFSALPLVAAEAFRKRAAQAEAVELTMLADYAAAHADDKFLHLEVAAVLRVSPRHAQARLALATTLAERLPATLEAFRAVECTGVSRQPCKPEVYQDRLAGLAAGRDTE